MVAWRDDAPALGPATIGRSAGEGYLKADTDTDRREIGRRSFFHVRRPYDIYSADGRLLRADVDNDGGQWGEVAAIVKLPAGRYVVASMWGTTYKKIQVQIEPNALTAIPEAAWNDAPAVYPGR